MITPTRPQTREDVARHYDSLDFFYRDAWGDGVHHGLWESGDETSAEAVENLTRAVVDRAGITAESHVCDVGCGYGETCWHIARRYHATVTGYTLSRVQCREARARASDTGIPRPRFVHGDWLENELADNSVDAIVSIECVSHVADKAKFFREIHRVLRPGGTVVLCAWLASENPRRWMVRNLLEPACHEGCLAGLGTLEEYRSLIENAGLVLTEALDIGPRVAKTWTVIFRRLAGRLFSDRRYLRFLIRNLSSERSLSLTVLRLILAYRSRCMGYGLIVARKNANGCAP